MIQNEARDVLNTLLVDLFNDILKIEASVLKEENIICRTMFSELYWKVILPLFIMQHFLKMSRMYVLSSMGTVLSVMRFMIC